MPSKPCRIALFAPDSPLFVNLLMGLKRGLESLGAEVHAGWPLPSGRVLTSLVAHLEVDVVFEINRSRDQIVGCDQPFIHLSWMQDFQWNGTYMDRTMGGSDLTYLILPPDIYGLDQNTLGRWKYLWPGVNETIFRAEPTEKLWDATLVGHMYAPVSAETLKAPLMVKGEARGAVGDLLDTFLRTDIRNDDAAAVVATRRFLTEYAKRQGVSINTEDLNPDILFLVEEVTSRIESRRSLVDSLLRTTRNVRLFGNVGWALWKDYAPLWGGEILDPRELASIYRASRLNIHNSPWPLHFRPLDVMACGSVVLINRVNHPEIDTLFHSDFEPGIHHIEYEPENFAETVRETLADPARLGTIGRHAARRVLERHTWRHRAREILNDIEELL